MKTRLRRSNRFLLRISAFLAVLGLFACLGHLRDADAQFIGYTSPQTIAMKALNAVGAPTTSVVPNVGQTFHYLTYTVVAGAAARVQLRLEGSNDGTNFFAISPDAVETVSGSSGIAAQGYFPIVRVNLVTVTSGTTVTANYSGTSAGSVPPGGVFNSSQSYRQVIAINQAQNSALTVDVFSPFGSSAGRLYFYPAGIPNGTPTIFVTAVQPSASSVGTAARIGTFSISTAVGTNDQVFDVPARPATQLEIKYTVNGNTQTAGFDLYYIFNPIVSISDATNRLNQTAVLFDSETVSAANTAVTKSISSVTNQQVVLYSVSARCSAGSSQLTVKDGVAGTIIWTTGTTEVGTTTFKFQWVPGLPSSVGNGMDIVLGACGAGNTGTLDVQASQF